MKRTVRGWPTLLRVARHPFRRGRLDCPLRSPKPLLQEHGRWALGKSALLVWLHHTTTHSPTASNRRNDSPKPRSLTRHRNYDPSDCSACGNNGSEVRNESKKERKKERKKGRNDRTQGCIPYLRMVTKPRGKEAPQRVAEGATRYRSLGSSWVPHVRQTERGPPQPLRRPG